MQEGVPHVPGSLGLSNSRGRTTGRAGNNASLCFCRRIEILLQAPAPDAAETRSLLVRVPPFPGGVGTEVYVPGTEKQRLSQEEGRLP